MMIRNVVITGKLTSMTRSKFEQLLSNYGIHLQTAISGTTDYLITNTPDSNTTKNRMADAKGVKKISELDFIVLLKEKVKSGEQTCRGGI